MSEKKASQRTISPVDGKVVAEHPLTSTQDLNSMLHAASRAQRLWRTTPMAERVQICERFVQAMLQDTDEAARELTLQMGRPITQTPGELRGFAERARYMMAIAEDALADIQADDKPNFRRFIRREPLGTVLTVAAWNYPYLIAVNSVVPALLAGNAVVLKHSAQTPLCADRFGKAFAKAGLPSHVFQVLHADHETTLQAVRHPLVNYVAFTGSVSAGRLVQKAASDRFIGVGLELGGKDPAYVRHDANLKHAVESLVDGSYFNSGQSCCGIERIYVHAKVYDNFVADFVSLTKGYKLGNPLEPTTTLGPVVRASAAKMIRQQVADAIAAGARSLIDETHFEMAKVDTPYVGPQVLVDVDHTMHVMTQETFGPVVGIMRVADDQEAVTHMNDSAFGLTASIWSEDVQTSQRLGSAIETGTVFMNRCDYLDPALAWVGVKDSGRGCTLSRVGYEHLTRPKSFHLRTHV